MPSNEQRREAAKRKLERQLANRAERARKRRIIGVVATVVGVVAAVGLIYWAANSGGDDTVDAANQSTTPTTPPVKGQCAYPAEGAPAAKPAKAPSTENVKKDGTTTATLATSAGEIKLTLDNALAPCTVNSFVSLAGQSYFNDTKCHRLTTGEGLKVLQCGDPSATGQGGPGYRFADEVEPTATYKRGTLAMANSGPDTNGSQFFLVFGDSQLPPNYTVFGTVDEAGLKVIDAVAAAGTADGGQDGAPKTEVKITAVTV